MPFATVADRYGPEDVAAFYAEGWWRPESLFEVVDAQAERTPDKVFATDGTASLTYRQLRDTSLRLARSVLAMGIGAGDRVAVQLPSWVEFCSIATALSRIRAITLPIMPIYRSDDVGFVLSNAEASAAITCTTFRGFDYASMYLELRENCPSMAHVIVVRGPGDPIEGTVSYESLLAGDTPDPAELGADSSPDDPMTIVYSSGTTARPKGCLHTFNTFGCGARGLGRAFDYTAADVQFNPSPITHTTGYVTGFLLPLVHGASVHLMEAWDPVRALDDIAKFRTTAAVTATTFLQMLMDVYDPDRNDLSSLRLWVAAGSPIPAAFIERAARVLPDLKVLSLYGRTENVTTATCSVTDDPIRSVTSDGHCFPGSDIQIVDLDGVEVARGEEGDIAYRGPMHMLEYIKNPTETAALFTPDGYSRSGDLGTMDADGYVRVTGRIKDIVIRGGMNISVRHVEDLLSGHPDVQAVAAVGMPDERLGEKVCLYLVAQPGRTAPDLAAIRAYLLENGLPIQKAPERLEVVEELPMTPTGKIQKHVLRQRIAAAIAAG